MRNEFLGQSEELILLITAKLDGQAYSLLVTKELKRITCRSISNTAVHIALQRLQDKGFVSSSIGGATASRGGKSKRLYKVTAAGKSILREIHTTRNMMWDVLVKHLLV